MSVGSLVPSWYLKGHRAEKHLHDLKCEIRRWADTHPYERVTHVESGKEVQQLHFTSSPPSDVGMIAADFVYNLRSGLDHLMAALVPPNQRDDVYFPSSFQGVWGPDVPGEDAERTQARKRWRTYTKKMRPGAVTILQSLQPAEDARKDTDPTLNSFLFLNKVSTKDRHQKLPVVFSALSGVRLLWKDPQGNSHIWPDSPADYNAVGGLIAYKDGTELVYPPGAMDMEVAGAPVVAIAVEKPKADVEIPGAFDRALHAYWNRAVKPLSSYVLP